MKTVILAGGLGSRLAEETTIRPKPMVEIGGRPMLWHIMNVYSAHGFREFLIACGYKGEVIKQYLAEYHLHDSDMTVHLRDRRLEMLSDRGPDWVVSLMVTGFATSTGGRVKRLARWIGGETILDWHPILSIGEAVAMTADWYRSVLDDAADFDAQIACDAQIDAYTTRAAAEGIAWAAPAEALA